LELCDWWLRYLAPDQGLILDPFAGMATTGVAAQRLGLRFVGVEKEQGYFRAGLERLQGG
jgi:DNA modification methylase